jgi:hypothetical protein
MRGISRRCARSLVIGGLLIALSGCFTLDLTLKPDGSGSLEYGYSAAPKVTEASEKTRFTSPEFTPESVTLTADKPAVVKGSFTDVTKVSNVEAFRFAVVTRVREGKSETLTISFINPDPRPKPDKGMTDPRITLHLPGKVLEARPSATATITGEQVVWAFPIADFYEHKKLDLVVKYQVPKG